MSSIPARPSSDERAAAKQAKAAAKEARKAAAVQKLQAPTAATTGTATPAAKKGNASPSSTATAAAPSSSSSSSPSSSATPPSTKTPTSSSTSSSPAFSSLPSSSSHLHVSQSTPNNNSSSSSSSSSSARKDSVVSLGGVTSKSHPPLLQFDDPKKVAKFAKKRIVQRTEVQKQVPLFSHLPQYERETSLSLQVGFRRGEEIHPAILRLGLQFSDGTLTGSNARCIAMLQAFQQFFADYTSTGERGMRDDLLMRIKPLVRFLIDCRPLSIGMGNAIRYLKMRISRIPLHCDEDLIKQQLVAACSDFIHTRILLADIAIAEAGVKKIADEGDVILVYAMSAVVEKMLIQAWDANKRFRIIIVDSRPKLEGKELLRRLVSHGLQCTYILINALSYVLSSVSKVLMGAAGMLSNGAVIGRVGSAVVGMMAKQYGVPVLIACETYKFHERVQLDSICCNELGDPDDLISTGNMDREDAKYGEVLSEWREVAKLKLLNLVYDCTPGSFVTMVLTEVGIIPSTSVPVILREYHKDDTAE